MIPAPRKSVQIFIYATGLPAYNSYGVNTQLVAFFNKNYTASQSYYQKAVNVRPGGN